MITIHPNSIAGIIDAPSSKSCFQRALAIAALANGRSMISFASRCDDADAAIDAVQRLGCIVEELDSRLVVHPRRIPVQPSMSCRESGLIARMFTPLCALSEKEIRVNGSGSLLKRDMYMIGEALLQLGVRYESSSGRLPITVTGPVKGGGIIRIDGGSGSQLVSGLLIALSQADASQTRLEVSNLKSRPYVDLTLEMLAKAGAIVHNDNYVTFTIPGRQVIKGLDLAVEGDWSGAAFILVAGAIAGSVTVRQLQMDSRQADIAIVSALRSCGAFLAIDIDVIKVQKSSLQAFNFDATECPDLFPPLVALAAYCEGNSRIKGVSRLGNKECDRATVLKDVFTTLGIRVSIEGDEMIVEGGQVNGGTVPSHNDHRIAMAAAVAALGASGPVSILGPEAVNKSYPSFYESLTALTKQL